MITHFPCSLVEGSREVWEAKGNHQCQAVCVGPLQQKRERERERERVRERERYTESKRKRERERERKLK